MTKWSFVNATSPWAKKNCVMSVKKCGGQTAYHDHVHQANQNKSEENKCSPSQTYHIAPKKMMV
jgi:hypothetical protein